MWVVEMRETFEQARPARARHRKQWEIVAREEIHFQNFVVGVWSAACNFAEEGHLEGVMGCQRLAPVRLQSNMPITFRATYSKPASSCTSRSAAFDGASPTSAQPPGKHHAPSDFSRTSRTLPSRKQAPRTSTLGVA